VFELCYVEHGGSGLSLGYHDVMGMDLDWIVDFHGRLSKQRAAEANAIKRQAGRR
jgi:hypothetical protein